MVVCISQDVLLLISTFETQRLAKLRGLLMSWVDRIPRTDIHDNPLHTHTLQANYVIMF